MLRRQSSLALRAGLVFGTIYVGVFLACLILLSLATISGDGGNHIGPDLAIAYAQEDMAERPGGAFSLRRGGRFERFAARNPRLWLLAQRGGRRLAFGDVPAGAVQIFDREIGTIGLGEFQVPGQRRPLADASMEREEGERGVLWIAAGGVDSASLTLWATARYFLFEGLGILLLVFVVAGIVATLLALPLVTAAVRPIVRAAATLRPDDSSRRLAERLAPRELLPLARSFNSALDRLASELVRRKRFIADMAHELRTPLAVLSLRLDGLPESRGKGDLQRAVTRLSYMVAQMLDVERLSLAGQRRDSLDLTTLAREAVAEMVPMALAAGYDLSLAAPDQPVEVIGDAHALSRALGNLIGNAIAHAGGDGQISVSITPWRTVEVTDEGPGIPDSLRANLFEPFCREYHDRDGCGLGLHLVREIMRAHGGEAVLVETNKGASIRLEFPAPGSEPGAR